MNILTLTILILLVLAVAFIVNKEIADIKKEMGIAENEIKVTLTDFRFQQKYQERRRKNEYDKDNNNNNENKNTNNRYSNDLSGILCGIAIISVIVGVGFGLVHGSWTIAIASVVSAIFLYSYAEIIQLLEDIKNNTKKD